MRRAVILVAMVAAMATPGVGASQDEVIAIVGARIVTVSGAELPKGVMVIRNGKIEKVAVDLKIPSEARVIDGKGLTAMPGFVHADAGVMRAGGGSAQMMAYDDLNPADEVWARLARTGITTLVVPAGRGTIAGQGVAVKPLGRSREEMVLQKSCGLYLDMELTSQAKQQLRQAIEGAKKVMEGGGRKPGPGEKPAQPPAPAPAPAKIDPKMEPIVDWLKGEAVGVVRLDGIGAFQHFQQAVRGLVDAKARTLYVAGEDAWKAAERLAEAKATLLIPADLSTVPFTRDRLNPAAELARAGVKFALVPSMRSPEALEEYRFELALQTKHGLSREAALRAATLDAAAVMGLEKRVGSLDEGKDADVLLFDGDPLEATSSLRMVLINGRVAYEVTR